MKESKWSQSNEGDWKSSITFDRTDKDIRVELFPAKSVQEHDSAADKEHHLYE